jgi:hypothetical protein
MVLIQERVSLLNTMQREIERIGSEVPKYFLAPLSKSDEISTAQETESDKWLAQSLSSRVIRYVIEVLDSLFLFDQYDSSTHFGLLLDHNLLELDIEVV